MRVVIAANACILILNRDQKESCDLVEFHDLKRIIVRSKLFSKIGLSRDKKPVSGLYKYDEILLDLEDTLWGASGVDGFNPVIHEFAHHLLVRLHNTSVVFKNNLVEPNRI